MVTILINQLGLNSRNSSKPSSSDPDREKKRRLEIAKQADKMGISATPCENLMILATSKISPLTEKASQGEIQGCGYESRQIADIKISRVVTGYRVQILEADESDQSVTSFIRRQAAGFYE